jgi:hypothetical protein
MSPFCFSLAWVLIANTQITIGSNNPSQRYNGRRYFTRTIATSAFPICPHPVCNSSCSAMRMFVRQSRSYVYLTWETHILQMWASIFQLLRFQIVNCRAVIFSNSVPNSEFPQPEVYSDPKFFIFFRSL